MITFLYKEMVFGPRQVFSDRALYTKYYILRVMVKVMVNNSDWSLYGTA
jgi:hypothetical protein